MAPGIEIELEIGLKSGLEPNSFRYSASASRPQADPSSLTRFYSTPSPKSLLPPFLLKGMLVSVFRNFWTILKWTSCRVMVLMTRQGELSCSGGLGLIFDVFPPIGLILLLLHRFLVCCVLLSVFVPVVSGACFCTFSCYSLSSFYFGAVFSRSLYLSI